MILDFMMIVGIYLKTFSLRTILSRSTQLWVYPTWEEHLNGDSATLLNVTKP